MKILEAVKLIVLLPLVLVAAVFDTLLQRLGLSWVSEKIANGSGSRKNSSESRLIVFQNSSHFIEWDKSDSFSVFEYPGGKTPVNFFKMKAQSVTEAEVIAENWYEEWDD